MLPSVKRAIPEEICDSWSCYCNGYSGKGLDVNLTLGMSGKEMWNLTCIARFQASPRRTARLKILQPQVVVLSAEAIFALAPQNPIWSLSVRDYRELDLNKNKITASKENMRRTRSCSS